MKKTLLALAVLGLAYTGAAYTTGGIVKTQLDTEMGKVTGFLPMAKITEDTHTRGVFGSTRTTTFDLGALFAGSQCPTPAEEEAAEGDDAEAANPATPAPAMSQPPAQPVLVSLKQIITHGPLPGFGLPAAASVRYELLINGQPAGATASESLQLKTEGEMPVLTARYGFNGDSTVKLKGEAGRLVLVPKDGKGEVVFGWPSLRLEGHSKADLSALRYDAELPELTVSMTTPDGEAVALRLDALAMRADHAYPVPGELFVYTGTDEMTLAGLSVQQAGKPLFDAQKLEGKAKSGLVDGLLDSSTQITLASVKTGDTTLGPMHFDFTLAKLDGVAYGRLMQSLMQNNLGSCPSPEQLSSFTSQITAQLPALLKSGPEFRIDRISVGYEGQQALITGKLALPPATPEQLENPMLLMALATANLTVALPDKLIETLATKGLGSKLGSEMALAQEAGEGSAPAAPPSAEQRAQAEAMAKAMVAQRMEEAVGKNWVVRSKDGVTASLDYRGGAVLLNGSPLDMGSLGMGAPPPPSELE